MKTLTTQQAKEEILELLEKYPYNFLNNLEYLKKYLERKHTELLNLYKNYKGYNNDMHVYYKERLLHNAKLIRVIREMV